jgi:phosphatidylethanolamine/phosphatidyl-N-methylethanolamine N-methyltransferase
MSRYRAGERAAIELRRVEKVYSVLARIYDDSFDWALGPGRRWATGLSLPHYPGENSVIGIDISEEMLELGRDRLDELGRENVDLRLMDARELSFGDETFDHVLAPYVISVVPEPARVMQEIRRVCKPGGWVVVVNHFLHSRRPIGLVERVLTPATQWIGFRMDLPLEVVTETPGLEVVEVRGVNLLKLWRAVVLRRL